MPGETLDELGIDIVNGQIPGLQGIYFATSQFFLDPNSANGWVPFDGAAALLNSAAFEATNGPIGIIAEHDENVPEPCSSLSLLIVSMSIFCTLRLIRSELRMRTAESYS